MKIAITGHSAGIGQALADLYTENGHEVIGLSRRNGYNIKSIPKVADAIEPCDVFVNNAQAGYAQTELLIEMHRRWVDTGKHIIVISTMMTQQPVSRIEGMHEYRLQKVALEDTVSQLRYLHKSPNITVVRPGQVNTQPNGGGTNPAKWAKTLLDLFALAENNGLNIPDISLR